MYLYTIILHYLVRKSNRAHLRLQKSLDPMMWSEAKKQIDSLVHTTWRCPPPISRCVPILPSLIVVVHEPLSAL